MSEYEETHEDAGSNYMHIPREGGWFYHNCDERLKDFITVNNINDIGLCKDTLAEVVLDNFEMVSGHIFTTNKDHIFVIDSYPLQEIESQIEYSFLSNQCGFNVNRELLEYLDIKSEFLLSFLDDSMLAYQPSDCAWLAQISAKHLQECIYDSQV